MAFYSVIIRSRKKHTVQYLFSQQVELAELHNGRINSYPSRSCFNCSGV